MRNYYRDLKSAANEDKFVVFLDNATVINACSILSSPRAFDPYKLLDLESFCEAFLLYDHVYTLVGHSFMAAVESGRYAVNPKSKLSTSALYSDLMSKNLLVPVVIGAGSVHYRIEDIEILDEVASSIDVEQTVNRITSIFGDNIPWSRPVRAKNAGSDEAWNNVVLGQETWVSDSYPIYLFPIPGAIELDWDNKPKVKRRSTWVDVFVSQTFFYVVVASLLKRPYLCSSIRVPIVHDVVAQLNRRFFSVIHGSLGAVSQGARKKIEAVLRFFGEGGIDFLFLPVLFSVLQEAKSREDVIPTLIAMRERDDVKSFRHWCRSLHQAWQEQDLDRIYASIQELRNVSAQLSQSLSTEPLRGSISHLPDVTLLTRKGREAVKSSESGLVASCYNPSLSFIKDIGAYLSAIGKNRKLIEDLLEYNLSPNDFSVLDQLRARREQIYSEGKIAEEPQEVTIERMEVTMGDVFTNINNSIIATRGSIAEGVISLREQGREEIAKAISDLDRLISEAPDDVLPLEKKAESTDLLKGITEETAKPQPNKSILRSLGTTLLSTINDVAPLATAGKAAFDVIKSLWM